MASIYDGNHERRSRLPTTRDASRDYHQSGSLGLDRIRAVSQPTCVGSVTTPETAIALARNAFSCHRCHHVSILPWYARVGHLDIRHVVAVGLHLLLRPAPLRIFPARPPFPPPLLARGRMLPAAESRRHHRWTGPNVDVPCILFQPLPCRRVTRPPPIRPRLMQGLGTRAPPCMQAPPPLGVWQSSC